MRRSRRRFADAAAATILSALAGCAAGPDFKPPAAAVPRLELPRAPAATAGTDSGATQAQHFRGDAPPPQDWWTEFDCAALNALVTRALAASPDPARAEARLREAAADLQAQVGATRLPAVNATLSGARQRIDPAAFGFVAAPSPPPFNLYNAAVNASYTMDIFGADRRVVESLRAQVDYQRYEYEASRLTLAANVVTATVRRAALDAQIEAQRQLQGILRRQTEIMRRRYDLGGVSKLDLRNQRIALAQARSERASLDKQRGALSHQLAVYAGEAPGGADPPAVDIGDLHLPAELPVTLSSALARRRPDVRAAEALWHAASAQVGVAAANLYPRLTLTAGTGTLRTDAADLANGLNVWNLGAQLMQPIFRGGELHAKKRSASAAYDAAAATYRLIVLQALQQVADGLTALDGDADALLARTDAAEQAQGELRTSERQYAAGAISEHALLDARRQALQARIERLGALADRLADTAGLLHALGGGYDAR